MTQYVHYLNTMGDVAISTSLGFLVCARGFRTGLACGWAALFTCDTIAGAWVIFLGELADLSLRGDLLGFICRSSSSELSEMWLEPFLVSLDGPLDRAGLI